MGNEYTLTFTPCWGGKGYTPKSTHTLTVDSGKENILTSILLMVEQYILVLL
jgi:hypothetical protein